MFVLFHKRVIASGCDTSLIPLPYGLPCCVRPGGGPKSFSLAPGRFTLGNAVAEVDPQGNNGQAFRFGAAGPFMNLILMEQELAVPERLVVPRATSQVLGNMCVYQPGSEGLKSTKASRMFALPCRRALTSVPCRNYTGFRALQKMIIVTGGAVWATTSSPALLADCTDFLAGLATALHYTIVLFHGL